MNLIKSRALLGGAIVAALVCNALLVGVMRSDAVDQSPFYEYYYRLVMGWFLAQVALVASWSTLARQSARVRLPISLMLILISGGTLRFTVIDSLEFVILFIILPFVFLQAPLWIVRWFSSQRIMLSEHSLSASSFSIRYLLMLTAITGVVVALSRVALEGESITVTGDKKIEYLAISGTCSLYTAALCYPCIWLMLSEQSSTRLTAAIALFCLWFACPVIAAMVNVAFFGAIVNFWEAMPKLLCIGLGSTGGMLLGLYVLRVVGYRLRVPGANGEVEALSE